MRSRLGIAKTDESEGRYHHHCSRGPVPVRAVGSDGDTNVLPILCVVVNVQCVVDHLAGKMYKLTKATRLD